MARAHPIDSSSHKISRPTCLGCDAISERLLPTDFVEKLAVALDVEPDPDIEDAARPPGLPPIILRMRRDKLINRFLLEATSGVRILTAIEADRKAADPAVNLNCLTEVRCIDPSQVSVLQKAVEIFAKGRAQIMESLAFAFDFVARAGRA